MNPQMKFRAWNGEGMYYGGFSIHATGEIEPGIIKPITVMQSTGLIDKNGVEIFEGDVMESKGTRVQIIWAQRDYADAIGFAATNSKNGNEMNIHHFVHHGEVIGNIYQHPELIKTV